MSPPSTASSLSYNLGCWRCPKLNPGINIHLLPPISLPRTRLKPTTSTLNRKHAPFSIINLKSYNYKVLEAFATIGDEGKHDKLCSAIIKMEGVQQKLIWGRSFQSIYFISLHLDSLRFIITHSFTNCLSRALRNENPKLLMVASAVFLPVNPFMVSAIHTRMLERSEQE
ncbi:uncharacterized protein LOC130715907 isoform X2 [Lotus japonicus]|uniref:uncharacterized protein LOC130715907 isoform X2 n=1 Tax=Lotus japonicus TaxID=34305 RepID=UPI002588C791|nr:uncharacterized protein LOC130715907 isoform X2 [Lotus japonicus]